MSNVYECAICQHINHSSRLHCSVCGVIPACYSITGKAVDCTCESLGPVDVLPAHGCERANKQMNVHVKLRTMPLEYYAD